MHRYCSVHVSNIWHDVALRGKVFMPDFFDLVAGISVQEPSLVAAKGMLGLQHCFHLARCDLPEVTLLYTYMLCRYYICHITYNTYSMYTYVHYKYYR